MSRRCIAIVCAVATRLAVRPIRTAVAALGLIAVGAMAAATAAPACGCGVAINVRATDERALITYHLGVETIIPSLTLSHVGRNAAVLFPVPRVPHIRALSDVNDLFSELQRAVTPPAPPTGTTSGVGAPAPPRVLSNRVVGGYRVSVLAATTAPGLTRWLQAHDYSPPPGSRPILSRYVARGWRFVAIRLAGRSAGDTKPLAIWFRSSRIVYPERLSVLSPEPIDLDLFVDASGPVRSRGIPGLEAVAGSRVAELRSELHPAVQALLPAPQITRLQATQLPPSEIRSDISITVARAGDRSAGGTAGRGDGGSSGNGLLILVLALGAAALAVAAVVSRRVGQRRQRTSS